MLDVRLVDMDVNAKVRASMKDKSYRTQLTVNGTGEIIKSSCDCPRGNWLCSHMAATAIYINKHGVSKTDLPNSWITKPEKSRQFGLTIILKRAITHLSPRADRSMKKIVPFFKINLGIAL